MPNYKSKKFLRLAQGFRHGYAGHQTYAWYTARYREEPKNPWPYGGMYGSLKRFNHQLRGMVADMNRAEKQENLADLTLFDDDKDWD